MLCVIDLAVVSNSTGAYLENSNFRHISLHSFDLAGRNLKSTLRSFNSCLDELRRTDSSPDWVDRRAKMAINPRSGCCSSSSCRLKSGMANCHEFGSAA